MTDPLSVNNSDTGNHSIWTKLGLALLCGMAAIFFLWPVYRASLNIVLDPNEGWNAYYGDAAMGRMPLYPSPEKLITNNYPPLSFYVVGALGRLVGDNVIAGRLLSLLAVMGTGLAIGRMVMCLGGDGIAAGVGAAYFVATMSRFFTGYVGMNDPQLLAHAVMALACLLFLNATKRMSGFAGPILLMVVAGFFKHNIVAMPFAAMLWLALHARREFVKCGIVAFLAVVAGFAACCLIFGRDFLINFRSPRTMSLHDGVASFPDLQWVAVGLVAWIYAGWTLRADRGIQFCNLLISIGLVTFFLQKCGSGVDVNAEFDLVIGLSIGVGVAFGHASRLPLARWIKPDFLRIALLVAICVRLAIAPSDEPFKLLMDPAFRASFADSEAAMERFVAQVRATPGDVLSDPTVTYRAGKPFVVDSFNAEERIHAGRLPADAIDKLLKSGKLTSVEPDYLIYYFQ